MDSVFSYLCMQCLHFSFLASGDSYMMLAGRLRLGISTVSEIIKDTYDTIWLILQPTYMKPPTLQDWRRIERRFNHIWHFPNCIGSLDGNHVSIRAPPKSSTLFHNYKGFFSIVLMALVDADYNFIYRSGTVYSKSFVSKVLLRIKWKFELN